MALKASAFRAGLDALYYSGAHRLVRPLFGGVGSIITFHRVRPASGDAFQPNRHLEISPAFLAEVVQTLRRSGVDIVSMDEAHRRLVERDFGRRFVALTFDDGYRDNLMYAWPILKKEGVPFTLYVAPAFADGDGLMWWMALEAAVARSHTVVAAGDDGKRRMFDCTTADAKNATFDVLERRFVRDDEEERAQWAVRGIAAACGIDLDRLCREACMDWRELAALAADDLVTIGAHTVTHPILARLDPIAAHAEMAASADIIAAKLGTRPAHLAYPVGTTAAAGSREFAIARTAGFKTGVTTRPGVLFADHANATTALPRVSVNGEFQRRRYLEVLLSGAPTALWNGFRRVNAA